MINFDVFNFKIYNPIFKFMTNSRALEFVKGIMIVNSLIGKFSVRPDIT